MNKDEIKKEFYKKNIIANFFGINKGLAIYKSYVGSSLDSPPEMIVFQVPVSDMGDAWFLPTMEAKHLIRYM